MASYSRSDYQNYKLDAAVAEMLKRDSERVLAVARRNVERWGWLEPGDADRPPYVAPILALLDGPVRDLIRVLEASPSDQRANWIRSNSPFAGVLTNEERLRILRKAREEYRCAD